MALKSEIGDFITTTLILGGCAFVLAALDYTAFNLEGKNNANFASAIIFDNTFGNDSSG